MLIIENEYHLNNVLMKKNKLEIYCLNYTGKEKELEKLDKFFKIEILKLKK